MNRLRAKAAGNGRSKLYSAAFFVVFPITVWIDGFMFPDKFLNGLYLVDIAIAGIAFWRTIWLQVLIAVLITWCYYQFAPFEPPPFYAIVIDGIVFLLAMFSVSAIVKSYSREHENLLNLTLALAKSLDSRDPYTATHSENVAKYARAIAAELGLPQKVQDNIYIGGLLHDIGKIGVPESVLSKQSSLTEPEYEMIKRHPRIGYDMVKHISAFRNNGILDMILYHHERYDGTGYPERLKGEQIPLFARIMAVADSFDAITSSRVYRQGKNINSAIQEICEHKGTQFDPDIVDRFVKILRERPANIQSSR
ncbi:HD-GYP domain-containing protein [Paenibacillus thermotolerans]|uniref:HD-GYP domain-containing protein n=1 Tax=Paenibacillus thermotolerans TaxID=3027807 RepID=UPI002367B514|nr:MULTISPECIES: HD-GYP domain-containing protein [unclassified Paenibacillus]